MGLYILALSILLKAQLSCVMLFEEMYYNVKKKILGCVTFPCSCFFRMSRNVLRDILKRLHCVGFCLYILHF